MTNKIINMPDTPRIKSKNNSAPYRRFSELRL